MAQFSFPDDCSGAETRLVSDAEQSLAAYESARGLVAVPQDVMLLGRPPAEHRSMCDQRHARQNRLGSQSVGAVPHQPLQGRCAGFHQRVGSQPIDADDDHMPACSNRVCRRCARWGGHGNCSKRNNQPVKRACRVCCPAPCSNHDRAQANASRSVKVQTRNSQANRCPACRSRQRHSKTSLCLRSRPASGTGRLEQPPRSAFERWRCRGGHVKTQRRAFFVSCAGCRLRRMVSSSVPFSRLPARA